MSATQAITTQTPAPDQAPGKTNGKSARPHKKAAAPKKKAAAPAKQAVPGAAAPKPPALAMSPARNGSAPPPVMQALFNTLPSSTDTVSAEEFGVWINACIATGKLAYKFKGSIDISVLEAAA